MLLCKSESSAQDITVLFCSSFERRLYLKIDDVPLLPPTVQSEAKMSRRSRRCLLVLLMSFGAQSAQ